MTYTLEVGFLPEVKVEGRRLGRHQVHDSRSKAFGFPAGDISTLKSVRHTRIAPVFDQGNTSSCTGNAALGALGTDPLSVLSHPAGFFTEDTAINVIYSAATALDTFPGQYPPDDTGSDGLSVAKVLQSHGWISGYQHALSLEAALTALSVGPVITGVSWMTAMDHPDGNGLVQITGTVRGGHEFVADELDVERKLVGFTNSWGPGWGVEGRFYISWDDWGTLLNQGGDVTILLSAAVFPPQPTPPAPTPTPPAPVVPTPPAPVVPTPPAPVVPTPPAPIPTPPAPPVPPTPIPPAPPVVPVPVPPTPPAPAPTPPTPPEPFPPKPLPIITPEDLVFAMVLKSWLAHKPWFYCGLQKSSRSWLKAKQFV